MALHVYTGESESDDGESFYPIGSLLFINEIKKEEELWPNALDSDWDSPLEELTDEEFLLPTLSSRWYRDSNTGELKVRSAQPGEIFVANISGRTIAEAFENFPSAQRRFTLPLDLHVVPPQTFEIVSPSSGSSELNDANALSDFDRLSLSPSASPALYDENANESLMVQDIPAITVTHYADTVEKSSLDYQETASTRTQARGWPDLPPPGDLSFFPLANPIPLISTEPQPNSSVPPSLLGHEMNDLYQSSFPEISSLRVAETIPSPQGLLDNATPSIEPSDSNISEMSASRSVTPILAPTTNPPARVMVNSDLGGLRKNKFTQANVKAHKCPHRTCILAFKRRNDLKRHLDFVHRDISSMTGGDLTSDTACPRCNKKLSRPDAMRRHLERGACGKRAAFSRQAIQPDINMLDPDMD